MQTTKEELENDIKDIDRDIIEGQKDISKYRKCIKHHEWFISKLEELENGFLKLNREMIQEDEKEFEYEIKDNNRIIADGQEKILFSQKRIEECEVILSELEKLENLHLELRGKISIRIKELEAGEK